MLAGLIESVNCFVVSSDSASRSNYGFSAISGLRRDGLAQNMASSAAVEIRALHSEGRVEARTVCLLSCDVCLEAYPQGMPCKAVHPHSQEAVFSCLSSLFSPSHYLDSLPSEEALSA